MQALLHGIYPFLPGWPAGPPAPRRKTPSELTPRCLMQEKVGQPQRVTSGIPASKEELNSMVLYPHTPAPHFTKMKGCSWIPISNKDKLHNSYVTGHLLPTWTGGNSMPIAIPVPPTASSASKPLRSERWSSRHKSPQPGAHTCSPDTQGPSLSCSLRICRTFSSSV